MLLRSFRPLGALAFALLAVPPLVGCGDDVGLGGSGGGAGGPGTEELVCKGLESDVPGCTCETEVGESTVDDCSETGGDGFFCCAGEDYPGDGPCRCQPGCARANDGSRCSCGPSVASIEGDFTFVASCDEEVWTICCEAGAGDTKSCFCQNDGSCDDTGATETAACTTDVIPCVSGTDRVDTCMTE